MYGSLSASLSKSQGSFDRWVMKRHVTLSSIHQISCRNMRRVIDSIAGRDGLPALLYVVSHQSNQFVDTSVKL